MYRHARLRGGLLLLLLLALGCGESFVDDDNGEVALSEIPRERTGTIAVEQGFLGGKAVQYYRMGTFVPSETDWFPLYDTFPGMVVGEMFVWINDAGELRLDHPQRPIIDTLPKQAGYSDFFELVAVTGPGDYNANDIKSRATLLRTGYHTQYTGRVVNCPIVGPDNRLAPSKSLLKFPLVELWYRQKTVHCQLMDGGIHLLGQTGAPVFKVFTTPIDAQRTEVRVAANDLYQMVTKAFASADQVTDIPVPSNNIFVQFPGTSGYTPLAKIWDVTVPTDYKVGGLTSHSDLFPVVDFKDPRIVERSPEAFCNCPVVHVEK